MRRDFRVGYRSNGEALTATPVGRMRARCYLDGAWRDHAVDAPPPPAVEIAVFEGCGRSLEPRFERREVVLIAVEHDVAVYA